MRYWRTLFQLKILCYFLRFSHLCEIGVHSFNSKLKIDVNVLLLVTTLDTVNQETGNQNQENNKEHGNHETRTSKGHGKPRTDPAANGLVSFVANLVN